MLMHCGCHADSLFLQYKSVDFYTDRPGRFEMVFTPADGSAPRTMPVFDFKGPGVGMGMYNTTQVVCVIGRTQTFGQPLTNFAICVRHVTVDRRIRARLLSIRSESQMASYLQHEKYYSQGV